MSKTIDEELFDILHMDVEDSGIVGGRRQDYKGQTQALKNLISQEVLKGLETSVAKVDRFEVIDDTGRAYVKGSIYGTPVEVKLNLQDSDRTLKVFVKDLLKKETG